MRLRIYICLYFIGILVVIQIQLQPVNIGWFHDVLAIVALGGDVKHIMSNLSHCSKKGKSIISNLNFLFGLWWVKNYHLKSEFFPFLKVS